MGGVNGEEMPAALVRFCVCVVVWRTSQNFRHPLSIVLASGQAGFLVPGQVIPEQNPELISRTAHCSRP